jgi:L-ribulokinase
VPTRSITSLGSSLFAFMAAGAFESLEAAQDALCPDYRVIAPRLAPKKVYDQLYPLYRDLYFSMGDPGSRAIPMGSALPRLREIAAQVNRQ